MCQRGHVHAMQASSQVLGGGLPTLPTPRILPPLNPKAAGDGGAAGGHVPAWPEVKPPR